MTVFGIITSGVVGLVVGFFAGVYGLALYSRSL